MNEKVETQNVDKICPLFGTHFIRMPANTMLLSKDVRIGGQFELLSCQKDKCQLWDKDKHGCSIYLIAYMIEHLCNVCGDIDDTLSKLIEAIRPIGGT